ncbi:MAG: GTPase ObgE [Alphaproteobacteria bacterium CG11_big_fil_rev_8_21_14_0_20_39_49]|nr:MAG: GTPase ObgE [Alphaproteobacteria bacterium CG11_big_fil_rev_8_21_14_0_20_39_49]
MQFIDEAKINIKSGAGGDGCLSFRREANLPKGGPDGGDGGRGGSVIAVCVEGLNTLIDFRYAQHFKAKKGEGGKGANCHGKSADDLIIKLPLGTQVIADGTDLVLADMTKVGQEVLLAKGGNGGLGNSNFKSSTNQAPRKTTKGKEGEELNVWLKLKLISDAGLVGLPNAGKSTFLSVVSRAKPKIADYPFTTLKPQLGVVYIDEKEFVMADIPGLIEGAHEGVGLGIRFLKHVERCGVILHLIDGTHEDVSGAYITIRNELEKYSENLAKKHEVVALNKADALSDGEIEEKKSQLEKTSGKKVMIISAIAKKGVDNVLRVLLSEIEDFRKKETLKEGEL